MNESSKKELLLYESGKIFGSPRTGGVKRFIELCNYLVEKERIIDDYIVRTSLCCGDDSVTLQNNGLKARYKMIVSSKKKTNCIIPPELINVLRNVKTINRIKKDNYVGVIVFDVPQAIGLCLLGVKNVILMIRKDMIGYEIVKNTNGGFKKRFKLMMQWISEDIVLKRCKLIICQCFYDVDVLIGRHIKKKIIINDKACVQINNVNASWITRKNVNKKTKELTKTENQFNIGFIGGFDDLRKGQEIFLETARSVLQTSKVCGLKFFLIGGGKHLDTYKKKYESDAISFLGYIENPIDIMKQFDLLIVPSLADSCPNTVLEGMYYSIPVLGSRRGGIPEILNNEEALFEPTVESLSGKIQKFIEEKEYRHNILENQEKRKSELMFDWAEKIGRIIIKEID